VEIKFLFYFKEIKLTIKSIDKRRRVGTVGLMVL